MKELEHDRAKGQCRNMGTAYADLKDFIHRKEPETHDFFNYRTRKPGNERNEIKRCKLSMRIQKQSQRQPRLCGNQTIEGLNECALSWLGQERQPDIYDLDVSEQLSACWQINGSGMATVGSK